MAGGLGPETEKTVFMVGGLSIVFRRDGDGDGHVRWSRVPRKSVKSHWKRLCGIHKLKHHYKLFISG